MAVGEGTRSTRGNHGTAIRSAWKAAPATRFSADCGAFVHFFALQCMIISTKRKKSEERSCRILLAIFGISAELSRLDTHTMYSSQYSLRAQCQSQSQRCWIYTSNVNLNVNLNLSLNLRTLKCHRMWPHSDMPC